MQSYLINSGVFIMTRMGIKKGEIDDVKLKTEELRVELINKYNIELLSEWKGYKLPLLCKCFCGKVFSKKISNIRHAPSCGCLMYQYDSGKNSYQWKGIGDISAHLYHSIKLNGENRGLEFSVTIDDMWEQFIKQNGICSYCGEKLVFYKNHNSRSDRTASLDRIDSTRGYTKHNIQWVHKDINSMKWDLSAEKFLYYCNLIVNPIINTDSNESIKIIKHHKNFKGHGNISKDFFSIILRGAKHRNIDIDISIEYIWELFVKQGGYCALTGLPIGFSEKTASLDRIDSNKGYTKDNIQWVHKDINVKLKRNLTEEDLYNYCNKILKFKNGEKNED
jgi:hypothetical protein